MNDKTDANFVLIDAIASEAYISTMVTCLHCEKDLMASDLDIEEPNDPMEKWAEKFGYTAKHKGWSVSPTGSIVCPNCNDEINIT